jgi:IS4 transposase
MLSARFTPFVQGAPVCVMVRAVLEFALSPDATDEVFKRFAKAQYLRELLFSSLVGLMCQVVFGIRRSVCDAYYQSLQKTGVSLTSVYNKLQGVEDDVSAELLRSSARRIKAVVQKTGPLHRPLLEKYCTKVLDGNHLASTEHRLAELRLTRRGPLPGQALVVYEPDWGLITDVFPCQDAHAQERALIGQVLLRVGEGELWIADRNFCTTRFIFGLAGRGAFFAIRQHESTLVCQLLGRRRSCGRADNGRLYEQQLKLQDKLSGESLIVRRVTLLRDKPNSKGEKEIHVLTNLPEKDASALVVMQTLYRNRWTIEKAFGELEHELKSEINTLGYPKAALFAFCLALCAYNGLQAVKASLGAAHGGETVEKKVSGYYLGAEIASTYGGMMLAIGPKHWKVFAKMSTASFAKALKDLARSADLKRYPRHPRGPKKPRPLQSSGKKHHHVSTARLLALRKVIKSP